MKPEPLKNKQFKIELGTKKRIIIFDSHLDENITSAVEWLREKSWTITKDNRAHLVIDMEDVDKAFEDVVK